MTPWSAGGRKRAGKKAGRKRDDTFVYLKDYSTGLVVEALSDKVMDVAIIGLQCHAIRP